MNKFIALTALLALVGCASSAPTTPSNPTERLVFGRVVDAGADAPPQNLKVTYAISDVGGTGLFSGFEEKSPDLDPKTGYYSITVPIEMRYFGIRSITYNVPGRTEPVVLRAEDKVKSLAGVELPKGNDPVYVGEISMKSSVKPLPPKAEPGAVPMVEVKDFVVRKNESHARKYLGGRGIDPETIYVRIFSKRELSPHVH